MNRDEIISLIDARIAAALTKRERPAVPLRPLTSEPQTLSLVADQVHMSHRGGPELRGAALDRIRERGLRCEPNMLSTECASALAEKMSEADLDAHFPHVSWRPYLAAAAVRRQVEEERRGLVIAEQGRRQAAHHEAEKREYENRKAAEARAVGKGA